MGWVHGLARSLVRDPNQADDIAQEAWLRATEHPSTNVSEARGLRAWLAGVIHYPVIARRARADRQLPVAQPPPAPHAGERPCALVWSGQPNRNPTQIRRGSDGHSAQPLAKRCGHATDWETSPTCQPVTSPGGSAIRSTQAEIGDRPLLSIHAGDRPGDPRRIAPACFTELTAGGFRTRVSPVPCPAARRRTRRPSGGRPVSWLPAGSAREQANRFSVRTLPWHRD